jgi:hypothetical protein
MSRPALTPSSPGTRKRTQGWLPVRLIARLASKVRTHSAILENISKSGAKLTIDEPPRVGSEVILQWHGNELFGEVSWASSTQCGLVFASIVPPALLESAVALDEAAHVPDELDVTGAAARAWFDGNGRFGFD